MTIDDGLDQEPAGTGTETTTGTDKAPAAAPPADAGHEADLAELDLLDADDGEEGEEVRTLANPALQRQPTPTQIAQLGSAPRPRRRRADRVEGSSRASRLTPTATRSISTLGENRDHRTGQALVDGLASSPWKTTCQPPMPSRLVSGTTQESPARPSSPRSTSRLGRRPKATLAERWGDIYAERIEVAKEGARVLPKALREMLEECADPGWTAHRPHARIRPGPVRDRPPQNPKRKHPCHQPTTSAWPRSRRS